MPSTSRTPDDFPTEDDALIQDPAATQIDGTEPVQETYTPVTASAPVSYPPEQTEAAEVDQSRKVTRAGMVWTATVAGLLMLVLLIIFIAQNQDQVTLHYFGLTGQVNLGLALFIAAVGGGLLAAIAGAVRIIQLRAMARKNRKHGH